MERFVMAYALGYLHGGDYRSNPLEDIAFRLQDAFERGMPATNVETVVRSNLDHCLPDLECALTPK